ncbi:MAG: trypsin-like peptidase domain-containing protein [Acidobacteria bacterium]|nr:trypsin-like peptidase domain-containing protein [Acidobacteriota bacterium]
MTQTPLGLFEGSLSTGIISATRRLPSIGEVVQITAPVSPGNSGSPLMNSEGEVIGVVTFDIAKGQNLNFAISKRLLERLLCPQDPIGLYR